jgi:hypothetical protein
MAIIFVPRPSSKAMNPDRPISSLLLAQIQHLQHAERRLPPRYHSEIYTHAIKTEGEAARYIREVTEAIHQAHADAGKQRARRKRGLEIAAAAETPKRKSASKSKKKSNKRAKKK